MKTNIHHVTSSVRSALLLTVLGCLLAAGMAGFIFQPASAARFGAQPGAAQQNPVPQTQELSAATPAAWTQDQLLSAPIEGGYVLEFRDGQTFCRAATE
jgi:hypothetical protein